MRCISILLDGELIWQILSNGKEEDLKDFDELLAILQDGSFRSLSVQAYLTEQDWDWLRHQIHKKYPFDLAEEILLTLDVIGFFSPEPSTFIYANLAAIAEEGTEESTKTKIWTLSIRKFLDLYYKICDLENLYILKNTSESNNWHPQENIINQKQQILTWFVFLVVILPNLQTVQNLVIAQALGSEEENQQPFASNSPLAMPHLAIAWLQHISSSWNARFNDTQTALEDNSTHHSNHSSNHPSTQHPAHKSEVQPSPLYMGDLLAAQSEQAANFEILSERSPSPGTIYSISQGFSHLIPPLISSHSRGEDGSGQNAWNLSGSTALGKANPSANNFFLGSTSEVASLPSFHFFDTHLTLDELLTTYAIALTPSKQQSKPSASPPGRSPARIKPPNPFPFIAPNPPSEANPGSTNPSLPDVNPDGFIPNVSPIQDPNVNPENGAGFALIPPNDSLIQIPGDNLLNLPLHYPVAGEVNGSDILIGGSNVDQNDGGKGSIIQNPSDSVMAANPKLLDPNALTQEIDFNTHLISMGTPPLVNPVVNPEFNIKIDEYVVGQDPGSLVMNDAIAPPVNLTKLPTITPVLMT